MPLNMSNLIALAIPTLSGGGGGVGEDGFDEGEVGDGVDGSGISGMCYLINQNAHLRENPTSSSSLSCDVLILSLHSFSLIPLIKNLFSSF